VLFLLQDWLAEFRGTRIQKNALQKRPKGPPSAIVFSRQSLTFPPSRVPTWFCFIVVAGLFMSETVRAADESDRLAALPGILSPFIDRGEVAGAVMMVATKDQTLHLSAVGQSDLAISRKMKTDDLFWIGAMSEPITAAAIGLLVDDRKLSFDDPVQTFIPEFSDLWVSESETPEHRVQVKANRPITVRDLLTHTSGLGAYRVTGPHWLLGEMTQAITREPLQFQPGTRWSYSAAGVDALARIIEVISGMSLADFLDARIFRPLEMHDTTFWPDSVQQKRLAHSYAPKASTHQLLEIDNPSLYGGTETDHARPALGGTGLFSTAEDLTKFFQMILNGGKLKGGSFLRPETITELTKKQTQVPTTHPGMVWGLGFCVIEDPKQQEVNATLSAGSFGATGAHGTNIWADPSRGLIYVLLLQRGGLMPGPGDSDIRRAFQGAAGLAPKATKS
jgi:CubicO group peptidase (beta-lactamase class C family)